MSTLSPIMFDFRHCSSNVRGTSWSGDSYRNTFPRSLVWLFWRWLLSYISELCVVSIFTDIFLTVRRPTSEWNSSDHGSRMCGHRLVTFFCDARHVDAEVASLQRAAREEVARRTDSKCVPRSWPWTNARWGRPLCLGSGYWRSGVSSLIRSKRAHNEKNRSRRAEERRTKFSEVAADVSHELTFLHRLKIRGRHRRHWLPFIITFPRFQKLVVACCRPPVQGWSGSEITRLTSHNSSDATGVRDGLAVSLKRLGNGRCSHGGMDALLRLPSVIWSRCGQIRWWTLDTTHSIWTQQNSRSARQEIAQTPHVTTIWTHLPDGPARVSTARAEPAEFQRFQSEGDRCLSNKTRTQRLMQPQWTIWPWTNHKSVFVMCPSSAPLDILDTYVTWQNSTRFPQRWNDGQSWLRQCSWRKAGNDANCFLSLTECGHASHQTKNAGRCWSSVCAS